MHVHLPKPLHGWRAFVGEVGIIVVGVLIALGAEQLVEAAHQHSKASQAEDSIRAELGFNLGRLKSRMDTHECVQHRLDEIQEWLDRVGDRSSFKAPAWIGRPQYWTYANSRWQAEAQSGGAALVDPARLAQYAIMYARMKDMLDEMTFEQTDWAKLRTLERLNTLAPSAAFEIDETLQDARYRNWRITLVSMQLFDMANGLRVGAIQNSTPASPSVCLPMTTTRAAANRVSVWPIGEP